MRLGSTLVSQRLLEAAARQQAKAAEREAQMEWIARQRKQPPGARGLHTGFHSPLSTPRVRPAASRTPTRAAPSSEEAELVEQYIATAVIEATHRAEVAILAQHAARANEAKMTFQLEYLRSHPTLPHPTPTSTLPHPTPPYPTLPHPTPPQPHPNPTRPHPNHPNPT